MYRFVGYELLFQPEVVRVYTSLLKESKNPSVLEAAAGAVQNLCAGRWTVSMHKNADGFRMILLFYSAIKHNIKWVIHFIIKKKKAWLTMKTCYNFQRSKMKYSQNQTKKKQAVMEIIHFISYSNISDVSQVSE